MPNTRVYVFYGGRSLEHEISCRSAAFVCFHLGEAGYDVVAIAQTKDGQWYRQPACDVDPAGSLAIDTSGTPDGLRDFLTEQRQLPREQVVCFPIIHGFGGEDGKLQGLWQLENIPFVGCDAVASALAMDKELTKRVVETMGVPVVPYVSCRKYAWQNNREEFLSAVSRDLEPPLFVKPACLGSSVGVTKVTRKDQLVAAIDHAFQVDDIVLVEQGMSVREIEYAPLGNEEPSFPEPGEIVAGDTFYSYEDKYAPDSAAQVKVPADISPELAAKGEEVCRRVYKGLRLYGMARIDLFLTPQGEFYLNEVNTVPGFTSISQFPKLWQHQGIGGRELMVKLVESGLARR